MAIYFMLFPIIGIIYLLTNNQIFSSRRMFVFLSFAFLGTFAASRASTVGTDTMTYETIFANTGDVFSKKSPAFSVFSTIVKLISTDPHAITAANALLIAFLFGLFIYRLPANPLYTTFFFISLNFYLPSFNIARQYIALGLVLNGFLYLMDKKYVRYLMLTFIGVGFHATALLGLIYLGVSWIKWNKFWIALLTISAVICSLSYDEFSNTIVDLIPGFDIYSDATNVSSLNQSSQGSGLIIFFNIFLLVVLIAYIYFKFATKSPFTRLQRNVATLYFIGSGVSVLLGNVILLQRGLMYFTIFGIYIFADLPVVTENLFTNRKVGRITVFALLFGLTLIQFTYQLARNNGDIIPYLLN
ncbi:EpsG family protein [Weissella viridescens]|uniref:EpsG family protein n=1 Tax=Weissella viridescens TaxID=1629 RepID=A0A3P2R9S2_WEIVI|nr:EpsG family protein [Weissella viridescens]RRG17559.1 EpsG family protein [Weissella viridescens]